ncbi:unnamed protein product, partial [Prorocentrum cordatum]
MLGPSATETSGHIGARRSGAAAGFVQVGGLAAHACFGEQRRGRNFRAAWAPLARESLVKEAPAVRVDVAQRLEEMDLQGPPATLWPRPGARAAWDRARRLRGGVGCARVDALAGEVAKLEWMGLAGPIARADLRDWSPLGVPSAAGANALARGEWRLACDAPRAPSAVSLAMLPFGILRVGVDARPGGRGAHSGMLCDEGCREDWAGEASAGAVDFAARAFPARAGGGRAAHCLRPTGVAALRLCPELLLGGSLPERDRCVDSVARGDVFSLAWASPPGWRDASMPRAAQSSVTTCFFKRARAGEGDARGWANRARAGSGDDANLRFLQFALASLVPPAPSRATLAARRRRARARQFIARVVRALLGGAAIADRETACERPLVFLGLQIAAPAQGARARVGRARPGPRCPVDRWGFRARPSAGGRARWLERFRAALAAKVLAAEHLRGQSAPREFKAPRALRACLARILLLRDRVSPRPWLFLPRGAAAFRRRYGPRVWRPRVRRPSRAGLRHPSARGPAPRAISFPFAGGVLGERDDDVLPPPPPELARWAAHFHGRKRFGNCEARVLKACRLLRRDYSAFDGAGASGARAAALERLRDEPAPKPAIDHRLLVDVFGRAPDEAAGRLFVAALAFVLRVPPVGLGVEKGDPRVAASFSWSDEDCRARKVGAVPFAHLVSGCVPGLVRRLAQRWGAGSLAGAVATGRALRLCQAHALFCFAGAEPLVVVPLRLRVVLLARASRRLGREARLRLEVSASAARSARSARSWSSGPFSCPVLPKRGRCFACRHAVSAERAPDRRRAWQATLLRRIAPPLGRLRWTTASRAASGGSILPTSGRAAVRK